MDIFKLFESFKSFFINESSLPKIKKSINGLSIEKRAQHEAAHGIIWYLFKDHWTVNKLTVESQELPNMSMKGALHISPNFNANTETNIQRANEIAAIALAGMIGQNIEIIQQRDMINLEIMNAKHFKDILDVTGCGGDIEIVKMYLSHLSQEFKTSEYNYIKFKILDLVSVFQNHHYVQEIHRELSELLIDKGSLSGSDLIKYIEIKDFQTYIEENNLDIYFFHQR